MRNTSYTVDVIILVCLILVNLMEAQVTLKNCSRDNLLNCPKYSLCTHVDNDGSDEALKCVCIENFQLNPNWLEYGNLNSSILFEEHYCMLFPNKTSKIQENKLIVYMRSPARKEHLVFAILMILLAATLVIAVLYGLKLLNILKRTKSVYKRLRYKRRNITPLHEMDELDLNRRYEMQTL